MKTTLALFLSAIVFSTALAQKNIPILPDDASPSDFGKSKAYVKGDEPISRIIVLLPNDTYLLFTVAQSPNLKALLERLPKNTITARTRLRIIHKNDFISVGEEDIRKADLSKYPLVRWDVVQVLHDDA
jgi:hypothetical protein